MMGRSSIAVVTAAIALTGRMLPTHAEAISNLLASPTTSIIVVDGYLDESAWTVAPVSILTQQDPHPGEPTAYATEVRVLAGGDRLYIGVRCDDPEPDRLQAHSLEFDGDRTNDDHITVVLDTAGNHRVGYVFEVNAGGGRSDGLISPSSTITSYDWNGTWSVNVRHDARGWSAELEIDVRNLQFRRGVDTWGLNIRRYIPRERMNLQWSGLTLDSTVFDLSRAGTLSGVSSFSPAQGVTAMPYGLVRLDSPGHEPAVQAGIDVRYDPTPSLATILTVNPDFAETEADAAQINLTRFSLFFPEKRRFFLEGSNQFTFAAGLDLIFVPFYSRRVGLVDGEPIRLDAGLKFIGQAGRWGIGALGVRSGEARGRSPADLFAGHFTYDVNEHLRLGTMLTHGDPESDRSNSLSGVDAVWHSSTFLDNKSLTLASWAARSDGDLVPGKRTGYGFYADYPNDLWSWTASAQEFGDALNPALGFLPRPGTRQYDVYVRYAPRPARRSLEWARQFYYEIEWTQVDGLDGRTQSRRLFTAPLNIETAHGAHFEANWMPEYQYLSEPFEIAKGVFIAPGAYHFDRFRVELESSPSYDWHYGLSTRFGEFFDGHLTELRPYIYWTGAHGHVRIELNDETDIGHLSAGNFTQRLWQLKASYGFSADLSLASFIQYSSDLGTIGVNARLRWIIASGREFFVVFNHGVASAPGDMPATREQVSNALILKLRWELRN